MFTPAALDRPPQKTSLVFCGAWRAYYPGIVIDAFPSHPEILLVHPIVRVLVLFPHSILSTVSRLHWRRVRVHPVLFYCNGMDGSEAASGAAGASPSSLFVCLHTKK